jgi:hypothetical protein
MSYCESESNVLIMAADYQNVTLPLERIAQNIPCEWEPIARISLNAPN